MEQTQDLYKTRGYSDDLLPKSDTQRNWKTFNYFTLWMGSVHNVPNYVMVGGFFILGLSTFSIMMAIILSAFIIALVMVFNGAAGSKYGVPFAMILRASYGVRGALLPGLLRGGIAAIMWFGLQCYAGSLAFLILLGKLWPAFLTLGGDFKLLGLSLPGLIAFLVFWLINVGIGFGCGKVLNKFTAILNPCIYIVFGGMAIWAISLVGFGPILDYLPTGVAKAQLAATAMAIKTAWGEAPNCLAIAIPIGQSKAAEAVLLMNWVRPQLMIKSTTVTIIGEGEPPIAATAQPAINLPAPVLSMAVETGIIPAKRKIVTQSIEA